MQGPWNYTIHISQFVCTYVFSLHNSSGNAAPTFFSQIAAGLIVAPKGMPQL